MLRTRLYLGLVPWLLLFIVVGAAATGLYHDLAKTFGQTLTSNYDKILGCYEMREATTRIAAMLNAGRRGDPMLVSRSYTEERARFQKQLLAESRTAMGTPRAVLIERLGDAFDVFDRAARKGVEGGGDASLAVLREIETSLYSTHKAIDQVTIYDREDAAAAVTRAAQLASMSVRFIAASIVGAILLSIYLFYRLARSLLRPIQQLQNAAAALGEGRLDNDVPANSRDELGELARTFNIMAAKLRAYREAMTERVTRARRTMEATLTSTPDPLFVVDRDGKQEVRNPAAEALVARAEFSVGLPDELLAPLHDVLTTGVHYLPVGYDRVITLHAAGEERHYLPRILAIGDQLTGFGGAAIILQDVTKFRLLDDVKGNLVATVSHELKTPLTSLRMAVYLLLEQNFGPLTEQQRDLLETAREDAERLLRILNDLLDLSRLEAGVSALNRREVNVATWLDEMAREMTAITRAAGQTIVVQVAQDAPLNVRVDPERVRHVFINLLMNASKYSKADTL
jgi:two-component system, NtrC family, sensor histidine kinase KinB